MASWISDDFSLVVLVSAGQLLQVDHPKAIIDGEALLEAIKPINVGLILLTESSTKSSPKPQKSPKIRANLAAQMFRTFAQQMKTSISKSWGVQGNRSHRSGVFFIVEYCSLYVFFAKKLMFVYKRLKQNGIQLEDCGLLVQLSSILSSFLIVFIVPWFLIFWTLDVSLAQGF